MNRILIVACCILMAVSVLPIFLGEAFSTPIQRSAIVLTAMYIGFMAKQTRRTHFLQSGLYALIIPLFLLFLRLVAATITDLVGSTDLFLNFKYFAVGMLMLSPLVYVLGVLGHVIARLADIAMSKRKIAH